jgi:Ca-activated chloride channel family protein
MNSLADFHFLRPLWLIALLPAIGILWLLWRQSHEQAWRRLIAPHLLESLLVQTGESQSRLRPGTWLAALWLLSIVAVAGPTWERESSPFADEQSAIVLALYLGPSMDAEDVQPTRLERGVYKIRDLLALRPGAPVALIAYAGSAHRVLPFTTDHRLVEQMAEALATDIMPVEGNAPGEAVGLAVQMLEESELSGQILILTDSVPPDAVGALSEQVSELGTRAHLLALAQPPEAPAPTSGPPAPALDRATLARAARALGGSLVEVSPDDRDVEALASRLERKLSISAARERERWRDAGYGLVFPIALVSLIGFRRGWGVRWEG